MLKKKWKKKKTKAKEILYREGGERVRPVWPQGGVGGGRGVPVLYLALYKVTAVYLYCVVMSGISFEQGPRWAIVFLGCILIGLPVSVRWNDKCLRLNFVLLCESDRHWKHMIRWVQVLSHSAEPLCSELPTEGSYNGPVLYQQRVAMMARSCTNRG